MPKYTILTQGDDYPEYFRLDGISYIVDRDYIWDTIAAGNASKAKAKFWIEHDLEFAQDALWTRRVYDFACEHCGESFEWWRPFPGGETQSKTVCF